MTPALYGIAVVVGLLSLGAIWASWPNRKPRVVFPDPLPPGIDQTKAWKAWSDKLRSEEGGR